MTSPSCAVRTVYQKMSDQVATITAMPTPATCLLSQKNFLTITSRTSSVPKRFSPTKLSSSLPASSKRCRNHSASLLCPELYPSRHHRFDSLLEIQMCRACLEPSWVKCTITCTLDV